MFPLRSAWAVGGTHYSSLGLWTGSDTTQMQTNVEGCHGTSGSGNFASGANPPALLGPTIYGGSNWNGLECDNQFGIQGAAPNTQLTYTRQSITVGWQALSYVTADRG